MAERKIVVPEGMKKAVREDIFTDFSAVASEPQIMTVLGAALRWLSENPIEPTEEQAQYMYDGKNGFGHAGTIRYCMIEWQRRMFLATESEIPEAIKDLLFSPESLLSSENERILAAYRRGLKAGKS